MCPTFDGFAPLRCHFKRLWQIPNQLFSFGVFLYKCSTDFLFTSLKQWAMLFVIISLSRWIKPLSVGIFHNSSLDTMTPADPADTANTNPVGHNPHTKNTPHATIPDDHNFYTDRATCRLNSLWQPL